MLYGRPEPVSDAIEQYKDIIIKYMRDMFGWIVEDSWFERIWAQESVAIRWNTGGSSNPAGCVLLETTTTHLLNSGGRVLLSTSKERTLIP